MQSFIHRIETSRPPYSVSYADSLAWLMRDVQRSRKDDPGAARALDLYERLLRSDRIASRGVYCADFTHQSWREMELFGGEPPTLAARMRRYGEISDGIAAELFPEPSLAPNLFQISCTGYRSPHAMQKLAAERRPDARFWHLGHMGCYAAIPALTLADRMDAAVSLFFLELCSLHLRPDSLDPEQIVINSLFADGAARLDVDTRPRGTCLEYLGSYERIVPGTTQEMTWTLGENAFFMTLDRRVPGRIRRALEVFVTEFLASHDLSLADVSRFAIHPGGPRIVETVCEALDVSEEASRHSRRVLFERGNMSSCSLPHIWHALLEDGEVRDGELVLSLAFGPGLTIAGNLLRKRGTREEGR